MEKGHVKTPPKHYQVWQRTHFKVSAALCAHRRRQKEVLETTSLKDLIK
jgi:hypothetical protein